MLANAGNLQQLKLNKSEKNTNVAAVFIKNGRRCVINKILRQHDREYQRALNTPDI